MFLCSFIADLLVKPNQIYMSHEEEAAELYPVVGCCAKAARLILLSAKAMNSGPQAWSSVCVSMWSFPGRSGVVPHSLGFH